MVRVMGLMKNGTGAPLISVLLQYQYSNVHIHIDYTTSQPAS
jgi:hypothetical protein